MMMPRRAIVLAEPSASPASRPRLREARVGEKPIFLAGRRPRVGERLRACFAVPPARSTRVPLEPRDLDHGVAVLSTLPNIRAHACHVQILDLEERLSSYLPMARLYHVSSDGLDAWTEVDEYHPDLRARGYTLDGADPCAADSFRAAFGVGVVAHDRIAHGLFLLIDGVFRLVHIPRQQLGTPHVSAFLRRAARIVRQAFDQPRTGEFR